MFPARRCIFLCRANRFSQGRTSTTDIDASIYRGAPTQRKFNSIPLIHAVVIDVSRCARKVRHPFDVQGKLRATAAGVGEGTGIGAAAVYRGCSGCGRPRGEHSSPLTNATTSVRPIFHHHLSASPCTQASPHPLPSRSSSPTRLMPL